MSDPAHVVDRWWAVWRDGGLDTIDEIVADALVRHGTQGTVVSTRAEVRDDMARFRASLEIAEVRVDARSVTGDEVWSRLTTTGVHLKTEEPRTMSWLQVCRLEHGRIAEMWLLYAIGVDWRAR